MTLRYHLYCVFIGCILCFWPTAVVWAWQSSPIVGNKNIGFSFEDEHTKNITLPIKVFHNLVLVSVQINNSFPLDFILDTGVQTTILTEPLLCDMLQVKPVRSLRLRGLGAGDTITAHLAADVRISLGQAQGLGMNLLVLPPNALSFSDFFGLPVYGIIGYDLFRDFTVEINYSERWLRLHNKQIYKPPKKYKSANLIIQQTKPYLTTDIYTCDGQVFKQNLLLDTGSSQAIALNTNEVPQPLQTLEAFLGKGLSGTVTGKIGRICRFQISDFTFHNIIAGFPNAESLGQTNITWSGSIGGEILKRFRVVFDYSNEKIYFKPNNRLKSAFDYNMSGMELNSLPPDFQTIKINYVRPNSPADQAGLKVGDQVLDINGLTPENNPIGHLYDELNKRAGRRVRLKILRDGKILKKQFQLISVI